MHYNQNISEVNQQYDFADLSADLVTDIQELEKRLMDMTQKKVILIAYEDKETLDWTIDKR